MANHNSAEKRAKQTVKKNLKNKVKTSKTRTEVKKVRAAIEKKDKSTASTLLQTAQSLLAKLAKGGTIKKKTAARKTSRLAKQVNSIK